MSLSIQDWLHALGLEQYAELFARHRIGFDVLPELTDPDLEKLQIPLGDRKRLLRAFAGIDGNAPAATDKQDIPGGLERRPVTALFIDLTDYTHLTSELGAEFTHKLARRFHELAAKAIGDLAAAWRNISAMPSWACLEYRRPTATIPNARCGRRAPSTA